MKPAPGLLLEQRYELVSPLPDRGIGESWRALDKQHGDRVVSVKLLKPLAAGVRAMPRDLSDALRALRVFRHDDVPAVLNQGVWEGRPFLVYDPIEGRSIGSALDEARTAQKLLEAPLLEAVFDRTCAAFEAAHRASRQVLHLGLTPGSVIYHGEGAELAVSIVDFGLAKHASPDPTAPLRSARALLFPAPEQLTPDGAVGPHTDVFSLGGLLREMLSLPPDLGLTLSPAGLERRRDDVPEALWEVVTRAMSSRADDRFASAAALREATSNAWRTPNRAKPIAPAPAPSPPAPSPTPVAAPVAAAAVAPVVAQVQPLAPLPISSPLPPVAPLPAAGLVAAKPAPTFSTEEEETATTEVPISPADRMAARQALQQRMRVATSAAPSFASPPMPPITSSTPLPAGAPVAPAFAPSAPRARANTPAPLVPPPEPAHDDEEDAEPERFGRTVAIEEAGLAHLVTAPATAVSTLQPPDENVEATQDMGSSDELLRTIAVEETTRTFETEEEPDELRSTLAVDQESLRQQIAQMPQAEGSAAPLVKPPFAQPPLAPVLPPTPQPTPLAMPKIASTPKEPAAPAEPVDPSQTTRYRIIVAVGILFIPVLLGLFLILRSRH